MKNLRISTKMLTLLTFFGYETSALSSKVSPNMAQQPTTTDESTEVVWTTLESSSSTPIRQLLTTGLPTSLSFVTSPKVAESTLSPTITPKIIIPGILVPATSPKTSNAMYPEHPPVLSAQSLSAPELASNVSSIEGPNFTVSSSVVFEPCFYDDEGNLIRSGENEKCYPVDTTLYFTCYTDNLTLDICLREKPVSFIGDKNHFLSYVRNISDSYPNKVFDLCDATAAIKYNIVLRSKGYKDEISGVYYYLIYNEHVLRICLPIFRQFTTCIDDEIITSCTENDLTVIFFTRKCSFPKELIKNNEESLLDLVLTGKSTEVKKLCVEFKGNNDKSKEGDENFTTTPSTTPVNSSRESKSDFNINDIRIIPPCTNESDLQRAEKDGQCNAGNTTHYITCYTDSSTLDICLPAEPVKAFKSNEMFFDHVRNVSDRLSQTVIDICNLTAEVNYNLLLSRDFFLDVDSAMIYFLLYKEDLIDICLPLFLRLSNCTGNGVFSICTENRIRVILFLGGCRIQTQSVGATETLVSLAINKKLSEIEELCHGYREGHFNSSTPGKSVYRINKFFKIPRCIGTDEDSKNSSEGHYFCHRDENRNTLYITCYQDDHSFDICLSDRPINPLANTGKFISYVRNAVIDHSGGVFHMCSLKVFAYHNYTTLPDYIGYRDPEYGIIYYLIYDAIGTDICYPIFRRFGACTNYGVISICVQKESVLVFFHSGCSLPPIPIDMTEELLVSFIKQGKFDLIESVCGGKSEIFEEIIGGISAVFIPSYEKEIRHLFNNDVVNQYWPCCYENYQVIWMDDPSRAGLSKNWSYLPAKCCIAEIFLMAFQGLTAILGVLGNSIILIVMLNGGHRGEPSSYFRTSLSISDFLLSTLVVLPAFRDCIAIINDDLVYSYGLLVSAGGSSVNSISYQFSNANSVNINGTASIGNVSFQFINIASHSLNYSLFNGSYPYSSYYPFFTYSSDWFQVIRAQSLCLCSCVTMIIMFCLSGERLVLCWRPLKYKALFLMYRVKRTIFVAWSFGLIATIVISYGDTFTVYWNTWTKLSFGFQNSNIDYNEPVRVISIILCIIGTLTIIISILALIAFRWEQDKVAKEHESLNMRVTDEFEKENLYITISLVLITGFYLLAYIPIGINILSEHEQFSQTKSKIFMFFSWWLLLSGSAINPFVYNFRSRLFKSELAELIEYFLPESHKSKMKPYITHPRNPMERYLKGLDKKSAMTGESHDGLPTGSKLARLGLGFDNQSLSAENAEANDCEAAL